MDNDSCIKHSSLCRGKLLRWKGKNDSTLLMYVSVMMLRVFKFVSTLVLMINVLYPPIATCFFITLNLLNLQTSSPALCSLRVKSTSWQVKRFWSYWMFWLRSTLRRRKSWRWPLEKGSLCLIPGDKNDHYTFVWLYYNIRQNNSVFMQVHLNLCVLKDMKLKVNMK